MSLHYFHNGDDQRGWQPAATDVGASSYINNADGNTLSGGGRVNTWDSQNRLVQSIVND